MTDILETPMSRRNILQAATAGALTIAPALRAAVYAQGSDKPEKEEVKIGFIPLTDCASVVMASVLGIDKKYGVKIIPTKEASSVLLALALIIFLSLEDEVTIVFPLESSIN